jgi:hypothetical protein
MSPSAIWQAMKLKSCISLKGTNKIIPAALDPKLTLDINSEIVIIKWNIAKMAKSHSMRKNIK